MPQGESRDPDAGEGRAPETSDPKAAAVSSGEPAVRVVDRRWWARGDDAGGAAPSDEEAWRPRRPSYVEDLERQLAEKDRQLQDTIASYRAAAQEFDEVRVRLRRDTVKEIERGRRTMLVELLDVVDNLDRAIEAAGAARADALLSGVEMVRQQFLAKLEGFGVRRIAALGQEFDPTLHEAVTLVPCEDRRADGHVAGIIRQGYLVGEDVLRPAAVAVYECRDPGTSVPSSW